MHELETNKQTKKYHHMSPFVHLLYIYECMHACIDEVVVIILHVVSNEKQYRPIIGAMTNKQINAHSQRLANIPQTESFI